MSDEPTTLIEELDIALAVGGLSPAQEAIVRKAAIRISELEEENETLKRRLNAVRNVDRFEVEFNEIMGKSKAGEVMFARDVLEALKND